jgi:Ni,Fe-hydrogenase III large subunit
MAVEAATGAEVPPRAVLLRALMAELERIANHLGDVGAVCNDAAFPFMQSHCTILREGVLAACDAAFGHRLMMDRVVPGGAAVDLPVVGSDAIRRAATQIAHRLPDLVALYEETGSLQDRTVGTGIVTTALAHRYGAGGHVGRASARAMDARRSPGYPPYDDLDFAVPTLVEGDVNARVHVRLREIEQSLDLVRQIFDRLSPGEVRVPVPAQGGEGMALLEAFRGELLAWVRLGPDGTVLRAHHRDASWFQWPLLETAIEGNIVADFPLCNKSFNCSYAGHDL